MSTVDRPCSFADVSTPKKEEEMRMKSIRLASFYKGNHRYKGDMVQESASRNAWLASYRGERHDVVGMLNNKSARSCEFIL